MKCITISKQVKTLQNFLLFTNNLATVLTFETWQENINLILEADGDCPNHVVMLHRGRFFRITPFDEETNKPWDVDKIEKVILQIENVAEVKGPNDINSVGVLTTLDRKTWAEV